MITARPDVALIDGYHSPQLDVRVRLNTNESPEAPPQDWTDALAGAMRSIEWNRYPDREALELRRAIGGLHGVGPEQIFVANGSNEVLQTLLLTFGGPGRTAAVWEPTYALHSHISRITGTGVVEGERAEDFSTDLGEVARVISAARPEVSFLCSPNNPTGVVDDETTIREVLAMVEGVEGLLVVDEAYGQFAPWSATGLIADDVPVVVTRTFSKTWSMAAARLGYLIGPAWLVAELDKVVLPYHLDAFKQLAGTLALRDVDAMEARVQRLVAERSRVIDRLSALDLEVWPSGANFVLFRPRSRRGAEVWQQMVERSILVRNCSSWPRLDGCLRVTIGTTDEDDAFLDALEEIIA